MRFTVQPGKWYHASVKLEGLEEMATNDYLEEQLTKIGFEQVTVTGRGEQRYAKGLWTKAQVEANLPAQVDYVEEM